MELKKKDTLVIKGVAIILMLIHHAILFAPTNTSAHFGGEWGIMAGFGKICVSFFCFLSGYGLMAGYPMEKKLYAKEFLVKRLSKLYFTYWFIWLFVVFVGTFFYNRFLIDSWLDTPKYTFPIFGIECRPVMCLLDLMGFSSSFGYNSYIVVAWYIGCIVPLYFLFPLIHKTIDKHCGIWILVGIVAMGLSFAPYLGGKWMPFLSPILPYFITFIVGIAFAHWKILSLYAKSRTSCKWLVGFCFLIFAGAHIMIPFPYFLVTECVIIFGGGCVFM